MISLLNGLKEITNNRACIEDAERTFIRLICGDKIVANEKESKDIQHDKIKNSEE